MLTQCPECKTTFRLHVNQLKAAAGKVRCSRCNTTFDALDNLFEAPVPNKESAPDLTGELPTKQPTTPEPLTKEAIASPPASVAVTPPPENEDRERITSLFDEPDAAPAVNDEDPLSHLIDELEESTANNNTFSLPLVSEGEQRELPADIAAALDALEEESPTTVEVPIDETAPPPPIHLPPVGVHSEQDEEIISAALDSIDELFDAEGPKESFEEILSLEPVEEEALPLVEAEELDEPSEEIFEEVLSVEPVKEEPLPLAEAEELDEGPEESFEEILSLEPVEEEALPLATDEELDKTPTETFEEVLSVEPVEVETLPLAETEELDEASAETFEEVFSVELVEEETEDESTTEDAISANELDTFFEETTSEAEAVDAAEELISADELDVFFEEEAPQTEEAEAAKEIISADELDAFFEEATPETQAEETAEELISADELDAFFEEATPDTQVEETAEELISADELDAFFEEEAPESEEAEAAEETINADELDAFFEEESEAVSSEEGELTQGDLLEMLEEEPATARIDDEPAAAEPDEESVLDEVLLPDEPEPVAAKTAADPLDPFSEEQLEHMLSPTEEQAAEEASSQQAPRYTPEVVELDSATPAVAESLAEDELVLSQPAAPSGYAIPTELTQAKQASVRGTLLWGLGIALMCGALMLQYLYYFRLQLVENVQLRPLLTTMCEVTGCELPPRRDLGHIELSEHLMQFHPNYEQSLLITATLANRADFAQPYPLVEVLMTDIEQRVVARRHFTPQQYMPKFTGDSFPANSEIPLMLEVVDPGNNAVGFEFRFY